MGEDVLPAMDVAGRIPRVVEELSSREVIGLLVTSPANVRYLTGFSGSAGSLFLPVSGGSPLLVTDGRYATQAPEELASAGVSAEVKIGSVAEQLDMLVAMAGKHGRIGVESDHLTLSRYEALSSNHVFGADRLVALRGVVEASRAIKDAGELARIEEAARIADGALASVLADLDGWLSSPAGLREADLAVELDYRMRLGGASEPAFETIVACGANAALPHHRASRDRIVSHQPVVIDFGATFEAYRSDMTRTVCVGAPVSDELQRVIDVVMRSQAAGLAAVKAGVEARQVDSACRSVIDEAGWGEFFVHGTGHGVGLDIHEAPWVGSISEGELMCDQVVTVEPGVYLPGLGGARIEDTVAVTSQGCSVLTRAPKEVLLGLAA